MKKITYLIIIILFFNINCGKKEKKEIKTKTQSNNTKKYNTSSLTVVPSLELTDINGKTINLKDFKGKIIMVNLWASWSKINLNELDKFIKLYNEFKDSNFELVSICYGFPETNKLQDLVLQKKIKFSVYVGSPEVSKIFTLATEELPCTYILNKNMEIIQAFKGQQNYNFYKEKIINVLK